MKKSNDELLKVKEFITLAGQFFSVVRIVLNATINKGNLHIVIKECDGKLLSPEQEFKEYDEATECSDFHVIVPVLFNFYHGLELLLKGFDLLHEIKSGGDGHKEERKANHQIENIYNKFKEVFKDDSGEITCILDKYLKMDSLDPLLAEFFKGKDSAVNRYYEMLRYPAAKNMLISFNHFSLKYKGEDGLPFFNQLIDDIKKLKKVSMDLYNRYGA